MLLFVTMPRTTEGNALVFHSNEFEYLSTGDQYGVDELEVAGLPQTRDFPCIELPEFFLIETVKPLDLQWCAIIQHDIEHDGRKQIQRQQARNKFLSGLFSCD